jgi:amidase
LVPYTNIASNDPIDDHAGPLSRSVMDTALCLDAISGYDGIDDRGLGAPKHNTTTFAADLRQLSATDLTGFKIGILREAFEQAANEPAMKEIVLAAAMKFKTLGATVEEVSVPDHNIGTAIWTIQQRISGCLTLMGKSHGRQGHGMTQLEAARLPWTQKMFDRCFPTTQNVLVNGLYLMEKFPSIYAKAINLSRRLRDAYEMAFKSYDVIVLPTTPYVAPAHGARSNPIATIQPTVGLTCNTAMFDVTGQPAMTIPIGWLPAKEKEDVFLPVGLQIVGALWADGKVLRAGHAWEQSFDWKKDKPFSNGLTEGTPQS